MLRAGEAARILVVGHAPGVRVHTTGIPWGDPSGERLRAWEPILDAEKRGTVTLLYSAHDVPHNGALVLRDYLSVDRKLAIEVEEHRAIATRGRGVDARSGAGGTQA